MASNKHVKFTLDGIQLTGYSVAGEETVISIPEMNLCFDIGRCPEHALLMDNLFLSHGHMDHAAGLGYYFSQRNFREMAPGKVFLTERLKDDLEQLLDIWGRIDGQRPPAEIIVVSPGEEYEIRRGLIAKVFETNHCRESVGFTIIDRRHKLKEEYKCLEGPEIAKLRMAGEDITYILDVPLVTYLGDTMAGSFEELDYIKQSKILLVECTFIDPDHVDRANAGRHYHIEHLAEVLKNYDNDHIVLTHLSRRTDIRDAKKRVNALFDPEVLEKITFFMDRRKKLVDSIK